VLDLIIPGSVSGNILGTCICRFQCFCSLTRFWGCLHISYVLWQYNPCDDLIPHPRSHTAYLQKNTGYLCGLIEETKAWTELYYQEGASKLMVESLAMVSILFPRVLPRLERFCDRGDQGANRAVDPMMMMTELQVFVFIFMLCSCCVCE
jgi:hypothetical protein